MLLREEIEARLSRPVPLETNRPEVRLPTRLKSDGASVRIAMLQRLAASRLFALGDRSGVLATAQKRSGRLFRLDVRQRVIVKALISKHLGLGLARGAALAKHVVYLGRLGAGVEGARPEFFDGSGKAVEPTLEVSGWSQDRHHFRFIISPEHGDRIDDLKSYVREVMSRISADLGEPGLKWLAICHFDTDQPHGHVLVRGRRSDGRDLVIPRDYMGYGFRARAQEVAQERLGDLSRVDAERRIWKATQADQFTAFDRRLLDAAGEDRLVTDGVGSHDAWAALTRGRLRHLEALGLATRIGRRYRLDANLEANLRSLQARRDVIRTLNERRLEGARDIRVLSETKIRGMVVKAGFHDEAASSPWVVVRDAKGVEHYARLRPGSGLGKAGQDAVLTEIRVGVAVLEVGRGRDLQR